MLWLGLSALVLGPALADPPRFATTVVDRKGGLPVGELMTAAADDNGALVFGSPEGLVFWDGAAWRVLRHGDPGGPPDNRAFFVFRVEAGGVWVVTESARTQRRIDGEVEDHGVLGRPTAPAHAYPWRGAVYVTTGDGVWELRDRPARLDHLPADTTRIGFTDEAAWYVSRGQEWRHPHGGVPGPGDTATRERAIFDNLDQERRAGDYAVRDDALWVAGERVYDYGRMPFGLASLDGIAAVPLRGGGVAITRPSPIRVHGPPPEVAQRNVEQVVVDPGSKTLWAVPLERAGWWTPGAQTPEVAARGERAGDHQPVTVDGVEVWLSSEGVRHRTPGGFVPIPGGPAPCGVQHHIALALPDGGFFHPCYLLRPGAAWVATPHAARLMTDVRAATVLPDGRWLAFARLVGPGDWDVYLSAIDLQGNASPPVPLPRAATPGIGEHLPNWAP